MFGNVWLTSDLHLVHKGIAKHRGFSSMEEHDNTVIDNINAVVRKRDKLFVLGDVVLNKKALSILERINCKNMELIFGNHDQANINEYLKYFQKVHGFRRYKQFWLTHCPIHTQEIYRCRGNIHGHLHKDTDSPPLPLPHFNVNMDYNDMKPVNLDTIKEVFDKYEAKNPQ